MNKTFIFGAAGILTLGLLACEKKADNSSDRGSSPVPEMLKIAQDTLPDGLESSAVQSKSSDFRNQIVDANLDEMKSRLFSPGPTDFLYRLKMVDDRLDEMATRLTDCADAPTTAFNPSAFVSGLNFPMKFGCVDNITQFPSGIAGMSIYFGKDNGYWYLAEVTHITNYDAGGADQPSLAVLAKIKDDGMEMEVWQVSVEKDAGADHAGLMHITANKTTGTFSISTATSAVNDSNRNTGTNYSGLGCGVQMITDGTNVYANGKFKQRSCGSTSAAQVCVAADLSTTGSCTSLSTNTTDLLPLIAPADISGSNAKAMIVDRTGWPTF